MKNIFKKLFYPIIIFIMGYVSLRIYRKISRLIRLSNSLPQYLHNLSGVKPKIDLTFGLNISIFKIAFEDEVSLTVEETENLCKSYIREFYPQVNAEKIIFEIFISNEENQAD
ncbi:MAG: hypothetical protein JW996_06335 [Candidatus Cloacimonetes bacterium]|nr:hypothetical protein [Candidatus Cloacimonadota bacterium]